VKNHKIVNNAATTEAREKISTDMESLEFLLTTLENNRIYLIKLDTDFYRQPSYLVGERASLTKLQIVKIT
jgi:hypothetical protein